MKRVAAASKRTTAMTVAKSRRTGHAPMPLMKARAGLGNAKDKTARLIARNPFRVVAGALALGFAFAKLKTIF